MVAGDLVDIWAISDKGKIEVVEKNTCNDTPDVLSYYLTFVPHRNLGFAPFSWATEWCLECDVGLCIMCHSCRRPAICVDHVWQWHGSHGGQIYHMRWYTRYTQLSPHFGGPQETRIYTPLTQQRDMLGVMHASWLQVTLYIHESRGTRAW